MEPEESICVLMLHGRGREEEEDEEDFPMLGQVMANPFPSFHIY